MKQKRVKYLIAIGGSILIFLLSQQKFLPVAIAPIESIAAITSAWSVWLLGKNLVIGWWVGIVGVIAYSIVFFQVQLYGEVAIQLFYLVTSLQAIYIWLRGGRERTEKPIERISRQKAIATFFLATLLVSLLQAILSKLGGAVPFWDSLTTVLSLTAQLYLMQRYLESWYIWILVDTIYVPLYASRGLYLTSGLYAVFFVMAAIGLYNFRNIYLQQQRLKMPTNSMNHPITVECFSDSYAIARSRFLEAAAKLGARIASFPVDNSETLFIDFAQIGPSNPEKLVVISSGLHGVEGFFGSAVQLAFLQKLLNNGNSDIDAGVGVLLIHAINPYGFAMLRRTNEDNIDLNRNFLQPNEEYRGAPVGYSLINDFLNPKSPPPLFDLFLPQALWKILRYGFVTLRQAIAEGQYEYPEGLFFGGKSPAKSTEIIQTHLPQWADSANQIIHLDFHTGLGKRGTYKLFPLVWDDLEAYAPLLKQFESGSVVTNAPYLSQGLMGTWLSWKLARKSYICLTAEFGTYPQLKILATLRAENRASFYGNLDSEAYKKAKAQLLEVFCPQANEWRQTVLKDGLNLITKSLKSINN